MPLPLAPFRALLCLILCAGPAAAQPFATPQEAVDRMVAAVEARDAGAMAGLYLDTALIMVPGEPALEGPEEIRAAWERAFADGFSQLVIGTPRNRRGSDRAASVYLWEALIAPPGEPARRLRARTLLHLEAVEGGWLIAAEMWQPAPPPTDP